MKRNDFFGFEDEFGLAPFFPRHPLPVMGFPGFPMPPHEFKPCKTDVVSYSDRIEINAELPGYKKEDIKVKIEDEVLILTAKKEEEKEEKEEGKVIRKEIYSGSISKSFPLKGIDAENIGASFEDGILKLILPKLDKEKTEKTIDIK